MNWRRSAIVVFLGWQARRLHVVAHQRPQSSGHRGRRCGELVSDENIVLDYALLDINKAVLERVVDIGPGSFFRSFGTGRGPAPVIRVGVGDVVQVSIFESSSGGLFIPAEAGVRPGNFVTLPVQTVDRSGTITIPFAGDVPAAGRTLPQIQKDIETRLANRAIEPQVIVTLTEQNATEVTVVGDVVTAANKFRIRPGGERVLDIISKSGGLRYPGYELFVTLQRGKQKATVYFPTLVNSPARTSSWLPATRFTCTASSKNSSLSARWEAQVRRAA